MNKLFLLFSASLLINGCAASLMGERKLASVVPSFFRDLPEMECEAGRLIGGSSKSDGRVAVRVDSANELLVTATFSQATDKNFRFGQRSVAGRELRPDARDKCAYFFDQPSETEAQVKYVCSNTEEPSSDDREKFSSFFFRADSLNGGLCRNMLTCWELRNCRAAK